MSLLLRSSLISSFLLLCAIAAEAAETVSVIAASGRQFRGEVDPRTNEQALWLRSGKPQAFVRRPIAWSRIVEVTVGEKKHSADEFRQLIGSPDWQPANDAAPASPDSVAVTSPEELPLHQASSWEPAEAPADLPAPIVSLHIDASVANWDSDVEVDGLLVNVYPLDAAGAIVPALGTLDVELIGQGATNGASGNPFPFLGRWSETVRPESVGVNGATLRLPFQWVRPDFNHKWDVSSFGMVHARLSVAGQGVFEDTASFTRIRPYSPVRDRMQQLRGKRFHPWELTGRGAQ